MRVHQPPRKRRLRDWLPYYGWPYLEWLQDFWQHKPSGLALIAANLLPLLGVIFLGWDAFAILLLYWAENVVIGAINVLKIIACNPDRNLLVLGDVDPNDALKPRSHGSLTRRSRLPNLSGPTRPPSYSIFRSSSSTTAFSV